MAGFTRCDSDEAHAVHEDEGLICPGLHLHQCNLDYMALLAGKRREGCSGCDGLLAASEYLAVAR